MQNLSTSYVHVLTAIWAQETGAFAIAHVCMVACHGSRKAAARGKAALEGQVQLLDGREPARLGWKWTALLAVCGLLVRTGVPLAAVGWWLDDGDDGRPSQCIATAAAASDDHPGGQPGASRTVGDL